MSRPSLQDQINNGIISATTAGTFINRSPNSIRNLLNRGLLSKIQNPGTRDCYLSALELLQLVINSQMPFNIQLTDAALSYAITYEPSTVPWVEEVKAKYSLSLRERYRQLKSPEAPELPARTTPEHRLPVPPAIPTPNPDDPSTTDQPPPSPAVLP